MRDIHDDVLDDIGAGGKIGHEKTNDYDKDNDDENLHDEIPWRIWASSIG